PPDQIAGNKTFRNLYEISLAGDHYKWRAMRSNGIGEEFCTGAAGDKEKFLAWARTVPATLRNPLYHWTHLELKRYFGIGELLDQQSAHRIWEHANQQLRGEGLSARGILRKFRVRLACTTDDPCDELSHHDEINASEKNSDNSFRVYPTFRPDRALDVDVPDEFNCWTGRLEQAGNTEIRTLQDFLDALKGRHDHFHSHGARLSDHGLLHCYASPCSERDAARIFNQAR